MRSGASRVGVAAGISRVAGLIRERLFARYLGTTDYADAFSAAMRIPAALESLLGVGVITSAFVPRYSRLMAEGAHREARHLARTVGVLHTLVVAAVVAAGVAAAPFLVATVAPGFDEEKAQLTVRLVRILFPTFGLTVVGSWCLAVLVSHRRFFLPYAVPVLSAVTISAALVWSGQTEGPAEIAVAAAWGALVGAALQVLVQLPFVVASIGRGDDSTHVDGAHLRTVGRNVAPTALRGLVHRLGVWFEVGVAGFVSTGAIAGLEYARVLYGLPFSLFTVAIATALLPEISSVKAETPTGAAHLRELLDSALAHAAFLLVPCAVAFVALGDVISGAIYQSGAFTADDAGYVWAIVGSMAIGLVGSSMGGMYATAFYALGDTIRPLRAAVIRLVIRASLGFTLAIPVTRALELDPKWGAAGLGAAIGMSGWIEYALLRRWLSRRMGWVPVVHVGATVRLWTLALVAAALAWLVRSWLPELGPVVRAVPILGTYAISFIALATLLSVPEAQSLRVQLRAWLRLDRSEP